MKSSSTLPLFVLLLAACSVIVGGCEKMRADAAPAEVRMGPISCRQFDQLLSAQQGKIVVVDTWATWCVPCTEDFPQFVALSEKYAPRNVVCMSVSVDSLDNREAALVFLDRHHAMFANYLIDDRENAWLDKWKIKGIPVVLVFDRNGALARKFDMDDPDNQFTYADVEQFVAKLVGQRKQ